MAIITRKHDWLTIRAAASHFPGPSSCGMFIPVAADSGSTSMPNSVHGLTVAANASSTVSAGGEFSVIGGAANITLSPTIAFNSATRTILYFWVFVKSAGGSAYLLASAASNFVAYFANTAQANKGGKILEYTTNTFDTISGADTIINLGVPHNAAMHGLMMRYDFDYSNDLMTATYRSGGVEETFTDTYQITSPGSNVINTVTMNVGGISTLGCGAMKFGETNNNLYMQNWRGVWDRMESEWLAGNRVLPKEFIV